MMTTGQYSPDDALIVRNIRKKNCYFVKCNQVLAIKSEFLKKKINTFTASKICL